MDKKKIPRIDRLKFHDLQYAKTADAQKRATQSSSYQPREINLRQEKAQKKVMVQRIKSIQSGASIQNSLESKRAYEKALKGLPSKNIPYEQRVTKFNAWVERIDPYYKTLLIIKMHKN